MEPVPAGDEPDETLKRSRRRWTFGVLGGCLGVPALVVLVLVTLMAGCWNEQRELTNVPPYSSMIGRTYRIVGDLEAKGVKARDYDAAEAYAVIYPRPAGVGGREYTFTIPLSRGQTFRIISAWHFDTPIDDSLYYLIELAESPLPSGLPVRLDFNRDLGTHNGDLNQRFFEQVR